MKRTLKHPILAALLATAFAISTVHVLAAGGMSIEDIMKKYHKAPKGTDPTCKKAGEGKASKDELAKLVQAYTDMAAAKPPKGDDASWKEKTAALLSAAKDLQAGKSEAAAKYKSAVNCKACHSVHKGD
jgi:hypothetical protein